jgi:hypothetical protein
MGRVGARNEDQEQEIENENYLLISFKSEIIERRKMKNEV